MKNHSSKVGLHICAIVTFIIISVATIESANGSLVGGWTSHNLTSLSIEELNKYIEVAEKAVSVMNEVITQTDSNRTPLKFIKLLKVDTQVVAGVKYAEEFQVYDNREITCRLIITNLYPWDNGGVWNVESKPESNDDCGIYLPQNSPYKKRRSLPLLGGKKLLDNSDKQLLEVAQWSVAHINRMSNSMYQKALVKVDKAFKQVINGYRYEFLLTLTPTVCRNNEANLKKTLSECPASNDAKALECEVSVLLNQGTYKMEGFNCKLASDAKLIGGGDHDYKPHGMIGRGDHDKKPYGMIGGGDHDYKPHGIIGGGDHDYKPHTTANNDLVREQALNNLRDAVLQFGTETIKTSNENVKQMTILKKDGSDLCAQYKKDFENFKTNYNKLYGSQEEEAQKFKVFCKNMERVKIIQKLEQGSGQYGATIFADISEEEFKKQYLGFKPPKTIVQWPKAKIPSDPIPDAWDWRDHGAVSPVKNQGSCGSCWAFSTTGNIEGQWAVNGPKHELLSLSEQELVDCDKIDEGCGGGYMYQAYEALMNIGGIEQEADYSYEAKDDKCRFNSSKVVVKLTGAVNISQDENEMAAWLYKNGPISIGINAFAMQFYMGGVSHPWKLFCSPDGLDHGVLLVGFGKKGNEPYWIIKNSWGPHWGVQGYYLVYRGDGTCGLNRMCSSATVN